MNDVARPRDVPIVKIIQVYSNFRMLATRTVVKNIEIEI